MHRTSGAQFFEITARTNISTLYSRIRHAYRVVVVYTVSTVSFVLCRLQMRRSEGLTCDPQVTITHAHHDLRKQKGANSNGGRNAGAGQSYDGFSVSSLLVIPRASPSTCTCTHRASVGQSWATVHQSPPDANPSS